MRKKERSIFPLIPKNLKLNKSSNCFTARTKSPLSIEEIKKSMQENNYQNSKQKIQSLISAHIPQPQKITSSDYEVFQNVRVMKYLKPKMQMTEKQNKIKKNGGKVNLPSIHQQAEKHKTYKPEVKKRKQFKKVVLNKIKDNRQKHSLKDLYPLNQISISNFNR